MEIQMHLCGFFVAKTFGHAIYEVMRLIKNISDKLSFSKILKDANDLDGFNFKENIQKIRNLLTIMKSPELIKEFKTKYDIWNDNKDDKINAAQLRLVLYQVSKNLYSKAGESNHRLCLQGLKEILDPKNCEIRDKMKKREFEKKFIKTLFN